MADSENVKMDYDTLYATYQALKSIHRAANTANDQLVKKNNELLQENAQLHRQIGSIEQNLAIQKTIVANNIMGSQEKHERDYGEIHLLKAEIKKLKEQLEEK